MDTNFDVKTAELLKKKLHNRDQNSETVIEVFGLDGVNLTQKNLLKLIWIIIIIIVLDNIGHESLRVILTRVVPWGVL